MIWPADFRDAIEQLIKNYDGNTFKIKYFEPVSGGDINSAYKITGASSAYFIKINDAQRFPDMFEKEALGLSAIEASGAIKTPKVIAYGKYDDKVYLILEWIDTTVAEPAAMHDLGIRLAKMHLHRNDKYGFFTSNFMGSLPQQNHYSLDWITFFTENRLLPQIEIAKSVGYLNNNDLLLFDKLFNALPDIYEREKPSLLHGDLWNGNVMVSTLQEPVLIDPATYYGNREVDIAMTRLFGGFSADFYEAYQDTFPLKKGWERRCEIWNLYPLLIHLNLFGMGYLNQIKTVLNKFMGH